MTDKEKCQFCELGQAKRLLIWRLVKDLSRQDLIELSKIYNREQRYNEMRERVRKNMKEDFFPCPKCGKICGNPGLLAMHLKSPGKGYRHLHEKFDKENR